MLFPFFKSIYLCTIMWIISLPLIPTDGYHQSNKRQNDSQTVKSQHPRAISNKQSKNYRFGRKYWFPLTSYTEGNKITLNQLCDCLCESADNSRKEAKSILSTICVFPQMSFIGCMAERTATDHLHTWVNWYLRLERTVPNDMFCQFKDILGYLTTRNKHVRYSEVYSHLQDATTVTEECEFFSYLVCFSTCYGPYVFKECVNRCKQHIKNNKKQPCIWL